MRMIARKSYKLQYTVGMILICTYCTAQVYSNRFAKLKTKTTLFFLLIIVNYLLILRKDGDK